MNFTAEQEKVIYTRGKNILVSAAAGSGKTAVLVERMFMRIMDPEDPVDIDRILTVTFTNAAAAEMRERIRKRLSEAMEEDPGNERIRQQLNLIHNANIMTIDAFSKRVLQENFEEAGVDPAFRVGDETEIALLEEDACDEILNEAYEEGSERFFLFLDMYSTGKDDRKVAELIMRLSKAADSRVEPREWLLSLSGPYRTGETGTLPFEKRVIEVSDREIISIINGYERLIHLSEAAAGPYMYLDLLTEEKSTAERILSEKEYGKRYAAFSELKFKSLPGKKDPLVDADLRERVKNGRTRLKDALKKTGSELFRKSPEHVADELQKAYPAVEELIDLTLKYRERLKEKKTDASVYYFPDIAHFALKVLKSPAGDSYREYFREVMTDEYQDSNSIQEALLTLVAVHDNYFCVGDVKQSIYGFRLAEPGIFMRKYRDYEEDPHSKRILLNKNFRSRTAVIDPVNSLFRLIMHEETGGVGYSGDQELYYGGGYDEDREEHRPGLFLIEKGKENENDDLELEASFIASRIEEMLSSFEVTEPKDGKILKRKARYSDFCILMRTVSGNDEVIQEVLESRGIPAVIEGKKGYFKTREIRDILNFLSVLDNPRQDIVLIALMKSPFGGFTDAELSEIRASYSEGLFIDAVENGELREELRKKTDLFLEKIRSLRDILPYTPIHEVIRRIIKDHYSLFVSSVQGRGRENLELLIKRSAEYEANNTKGLFRFLRYIERMKKYNMDFSEAASGDSVNAVRILSIHKSKGLEFPVVFLADTDKQFNMSDLRDDVVIHRDAGLGISLTDPETRVKFKTIEREVIARKMKSDLIGEELRILYVALTRAKEKLIISGVLKEADKAFEKQLSVENAMSYLDLLILALQAEDGDLKEKLDIVTVDAEELTLKRIETGVDLERRKSFVTDGAEDEESEALKEIREGLDLQYPFKDAETTPSKVSVSELKIRAMEDDEFRDLAEAQDISYLLSEESEDGEEREERRRKMRAAAEYGTAYHKIMSLIPEDPLAGEKGVKSMLRELLQNGSITEMERDMVDPEDISGFLQTDLFKRMNEANKRHDLFREQPFIISRPANEVFPGGPEGEKVQIQGIIDAFFIEKGAVTVMDYKTDHVNDPSVLVKRYKKQLELYSDAISRILSMPVKERKIYSVHLKKEIDL